MLDAQRVRSILSCLVVLLLAIVLAALVHGIAQRGPTIDPVRAKTVQSLKTNVATPEQFVQMLENRDGARPVQAAPVDCRAVRRFCVQNSDCDTMCDGKTLDPNTRYQCVEGPEKGAPKSCRVRPVDPEGVEVVKNCPESKGFITIHQVDPVTNRRRWRCYNTKPLLYRDDGSFQKWVCNGKGLNSNGHCDCPAYERSFVHLYDPNRIPFCGPQNLNRILLSIIPSEESTM